MEGKSEAVRGLVIIPGISSGPFGSPFDEVVDELFSRCRVVRIDAWEGAGDLEEMSLKDLHEIIGEARELLKSNGCESIDVLGKSFGGMLALTYPDNMSFEKMVLWAPAVGIGENNVSKWRSSLLEHASTATDVSIDRKYLEDLDFHTLIVHGTEDEVVDASNSRKICEALPECELKLIEDADHSFSSFEEDVSSLSVEFLEASKQVG